MPDLIPELEDYLQQFRATRRDATELCHGLNATRGNWRPAPGRWSVVECLIHLTVSAHVYCGQIRPVVERARTRGMLGTGPFRYGLLARWLLRSIEPPVRSRTKTPRRFHPAPEGTHDVPETLAAFVAAGAEWEDCLDRANGLDLARVKVASPVVSLIRFQLGALFAGQAAHERRHLWQAHQVLVAPGFPAG